MKHTPKKKFAALLCASVTALTAFSALPASAGTAARNNTTVIVLGDSISTGYNLQRDDYCYADYIAEYLDAGHYYNWAKNGLTSGELLEQLQDGTTQTIAVTDADLVLVSVGANDMLNAIKDYVKTYAKEGEGFKEYFLRIAKSGSQAVTDATFKLTRALNTPRNTMLENLKQINERIHELNPDVTVVFQKLYNPFESSTTVYNGTDYSEQYQMFLDYLRGHFKQINNGIGGLKDAVIADPYTLFRDKAWEYIFAEKEDIHPNVLGHAVIAADILNRLGYPDAVVPQFEYVIRNMKKCTSVVYIRTATRDLLYPHAGLKRTHEFCDTDLDGKVTSADASKTLLYYVTFCTSHIDENDPSVADILLKGEQQLLADADGDGVVDAFDASLSLRYSTMKYSGGYDDLTLDDVLS